MSNLEISIFYYSSLTLDIFFTGLLAHLIFNQRKEFKTLFQKIFFIGIFIQSFLSMCFLLYVLWGV